MMSFRPLIHAMKITKTLHVSTREEWRSWLKKHYRTEPDIWLIYYKKQAEKPRIPYNDAVEEALCFGWIDSTLKPVDALRFAQRYSPRRKGSGYSQPNRERLRRLVATGRVAHDILPAVEEVLNEPFIASEDILAVLQEDPEGWSNFQRFSDAYQRIRIAFIESARDRPEQFTKRLRYLVRMNAKNRQYGSGIESFY